MTSPIDKLLAESKRLREACPGLDPTFSDAIYYAHLITTSEAKDEIIRVLMEALGAINHPALWLDGGSDLVVTTAEQALTQANALAASVIEDNGK